jgi:hypothetical protein
MKLPPANQKASREFRNRIAKLQQIAVKAAAPANRVALVLPTLPALFDAALSANMPHTLRAGAKLIRAMAQAGLATATEKAQANAYLSDPMA